MMCQFTCTIAPGKWGSIFTNCFSDNGRTSNKAFLYIPYVESALSNGTTLSSQKKNIHFDQSVSSFGNPIDKNFVSDPPENKIKQYKIKIDHYDTYKFKNTECII